MRLLACAFLPLAVCAPAAAQSSLLFTGRFPFVSIDNPNERPGGSITQLSEFAISTVTPGQGAFARTWMPATAHGAYAGDPTGSGNYTYFGGFKSYFDRINLADPFVKNADRSKADPRLVYWTVRDADAAKDLTVFTTNGTQTVIVQGGDVVRWDENGNLEFFITQAQVMKAAGPQPASFVNGASSMCQDAQGNLYYSPAEGFNASGAPAAGHYVSANNLSSGPVFCFIGAIIKIPAAAITYDARGHVLDVAANSSYQVFSDRDSAFGTSLRQMVANAGTVDRDGVLVSNPATFYNVVGLDLDPNGGTVTAGYPVGDPPNQVFDQVPNLVFCADDGKWAGTIWSTAPNSVGLDGSLAVINGVKCGSDNTAIPADGSWLGVQLDKPNFQPTLMGLAVIDALPHTPHVADLPNFGAVAATDPNLEIDFNAAPGSGIFIVLTVGPNTPGRFTPALDFGGALGPTSFNTLFTLPNPFLPTPLSAFVANADANGYATFSAPNPLLRPGLTLVAHGGALSATFQVSNPVQLQFK